MVCYSQTAALQYARERINEVYSNDPSNSGALTVQPQSRPQHRVSPQPSLPREHFDTEHFDCDLQQQQQQQTPQQPLDSRLGAEGPAAEREEDQAIAVQRAAAMLVTELPSLLEAPPHDHNHNRSDTDCDEVDNRAERYLFPQSFKEIPPYNPADRKANQSRQPLTHTLKKSFPNGFPNFNNFRNNPQGFYDNLCYDAGYASEKSPEEEELPALFDIETVGSSREETETPESGEDGPSEHGEESEDNHNEQQAEPERSVIQKMMAENVQLTTEMLMDIYTFINEGTMFDVTVEKNSRGLGLSVSGGRESRGRYAGLLRIRKLYPQMPAWLCGQLQLGDILLEANETCLSGLASHEALEVLRTTKTSGVHLLVCRPPVGAIAELSSSPLGGDLSLPGCSNTEVVSTSLLGRPGLSPHHLAPSPVHSICGEFEVSLTKVKGSLGFTLRKRDNSVLGHTIRTLVREPALSDGRIKPGDKILSVNSTDLCGLSHEEAIAFLRTTPETVAIRLYRDVTQTPVSPLSPIEPEDSILKPKPLRQEARDMLSDLAFRKRSSPSMSPSANGSHSASPGNPRRRRLQKTPTPDVSKKVVADRFDSLIRKMEETPERSAIEEQPSLSMAMRSSHDSSPLGNRGSCASSTSRESTLISRNTSNASTDTNSLSESSDCRRKRPNFLDLDNRQSCSRKTQFTPPHEENYSFPSPSSSNDNQFHSLCSVDSAPPLGSTQSFSPSYAHMQPAYQSVNFGNIQYQNNEHSRLTGTASDYTISSSYMTNENKSPEQKSGLLKWKGRMLPPDEDESNHDSDESDTEETSTGMEAASDNQRSHRMKEVTISLQRGWNSRLGFSLQAEGEATKVIAIYAGCVAAKDGRLKIGDEILKVNSEDVTGWETEKVIDMLRKTHGKIDLHVLQQPF